MSYEKVALSRCHEYDTKALEGLLLSHFEDLGVDSSLFKDKKIVIKPNLVMNKAPEFAATTHPAVVRAAARVIKKLGGENITVAESYGGPYTPMSLKAYYKGCGIKEVADEEGLLLNYEVGAGEMTFPDGKACRSFNIIDPIRESDVIINICKLKTHSLTKMSYAVKNFFGTVPGVEKFEMHARFPQNCDFITMITDLCEMLCKKKTVISICDGILGMEGNGPTGGVPRNFGVLLTSRSPFCLDLVAEKLLDFEGTVPMVRESVSRGLIPNSANEITIIGDSIDSCIIPHVVLPDTSSLSILTKLPDIMGGRFASFFSPHPEIKRKTCIGCGKCAQSCPAHTITVVKGKAVINHDNCIKCYCCQELCPINSVYIKKNPLIRLVQKL